MVSVRFIHHHTINGVSYLPGNVVEFPPDLAAQLVYAWIAAYTDAPPTPQSGPDPFPQYVLDTDLATAPTGSKVVLRTPGGQVKAAAPAETDDAATRGWVSTQFEGFTPSAFTPTIENAPAAAMFARVCVSGMWPTRGTTRTDVVVMWISTAATDPVPPIGGTGATGNDVWMKVDA